MTDDATGLSPEEERGGPSHHAGGERASKTLSWPLIALLTVVGMLLSAGLAFLLVTKVDPAMKNQQAKKDLTQVVEARGPVEAQNTSLVTFKGQQVQNANAQQKSLGTGTTSTTPAALIFSNGRGTARKNVDIFLDLSSQRSRDFVMIHHQTLTALMESGTAQVKVYPVPTGDAFSVYAGEALAESFYTSKEEAWPFLLRLAQEGSSLKTDKREDVVRAVVKAAQEADVKNVDEASIQNGTFASWLLTIGDNPQLQAGTYPPLVYVNGSLVNGTTVNLNDPEVLRRSIVQ